MSWVSAFINRNGYPARVKNAWVDGRFEVILSVPLIQEISDVLHRPRIKAKYRISEDEIARFLELLLRRAILVTVSGRIKLCRDERDNVVLETAIKGGAEYLVSRDGDIKGDTELIRQMRVSGAHVLTVSQFLRQLGTEGR
jgi:uncharacterized protein